jgi:hypothetical protein
VAMMRKILSGIVLLLPLPATGQQMRLPNLVPEGWVETYADIGTKTRRFVSPDGQSIMTSSESVAHRGSLQRDMDGIAYHSGERLTYQRRSDSWIAVSGYKDRHIFYRKSNLACGGSRWHNIELEYPIEEKRRMDNPVTQIAHDMALYSEDCGQTN